MELKKKMHYRNLDVEQIRIGNNLFEFDKSSNAATFTVDFKCKRIIYDFHPNANKDHYFYVIDLAKISSIKFDTKFGNYELSLKQNGVLYYSDRKNINFSNFVGQTGFIKKVSLNNDSFNFNNVSMVNRYKGFFTKFKHTVTFDNSVKASKVKDLLDPFFSKPSLKRKKDESTLETRKRRKFDFNESCYNLNKSNHNKNEYTIVFPCHKEVQRKKNFSELFQILPCPKCDLIYRYSFCSDSLVKNSLIYHCIHSNICQVFSLCSTCSE